MTEAGFPPPQPLTCPMGGLQAFAGLEGEPRVPKDPRIVFPTAGGAADVRFLHDVPDLQGVQGLGEDR